jgi:hypothetical protein
MVPNEEKQGGGIFTHTHVRVRHPDQCHQPLVVLEVWVGQYVPAQLKHLLQIAVETPPSKQYSLRRQQMKLLMLAPPKRNTSVASLRRHWLSCTCIPGTAAKDLRAQRW